MRHLAIFCILLCNCIYTLAQESPHVTIYHEKTEMGYRILVSNDEYCEVSVYLAFDLNNLRSSRGNNKIFVIPARGRGRRITDLNIVRKDRSYSFRYESTAYLGNVNNRSYDSLHVYNLPYKDGASYKLIQGYDGIFSHQGKHALDFSMPEGTDVVAMREGTVVLAKMHNQNNCVHPECIRFNNEIVIAHDDGTFSEYAHLKYKSALVKAGDKVKPGDVIAKSGNTGYSTAPHLHISVYRNRMEGKITMPTMFKVKDSKNPILLEQGLSYTK